ncbi:hypothetical protein CUMW_092560 [Citrus unshiu]|nr:hypothetical protein CUMW_092560 [Citrus unshiu]
MASMIVASSNAKPLSPLPITSQSPKPRIQIPQIKIPQKLLKLSSSALKSLSAVAVTSLAFSPPSLAAEIEKAALFDFNLTLPIIMVEFLVLMFALDKIYYSPLGNFMDERDNAIKEKLNSVKDTSEEVKQLEEQAAAVMRAARAEISAALTKMKKETQLEVEQKLAVGRKKIEAELQEALANLERQKEDTIKSLDSQIAALSEEIVRKLSINLYSVQLACENCPCEVVRARILSSPCESRSGHSSNPSSSFKSKFNDDTDCNEMKFLIW